MSYSSEFYARWAATAQAEEKRSGLPASVTLAQGMIESKSSKGQFLSELASKYNNYFGIKADSRWTGKKVELWTTEEIGGVRKKVKAWFRVYDKPEDSWVDHTNFLLENPRYTEHGVFSTNDPRTVATALKSAGYATDSGYASFIMSVINGSRLTKYDQGTKPIGDPSKAPKTDVTSGGGTGDSVTPVGEDSSSGSSNGDSIFGLGTTFGVNLDRIAAIALSMLFGLLLVGTGLFVTFKT